MKIIRYVILSVLVMWAPHAVSQQGSDLSIIVVPAIDDDITAFGGSVLSAMETKMKAGFNRKNFVVVSKNELSGGAGGGNFDISKPMRTDQWLRLMTVAKKKSKFADVRAAVFYKVYFTSMSESFGTIFQMDLLGEVHDLQSGRLLCDFSADEQMVFQVSNECIESNDNGACISMEARPYTQEWAQQIINPAAKCLNRLTKGKGESGGLTNSFNFKFEYFSMRQVMEIRDVMATWPDGVKSGNLEGSEPVMKFSYSTKRPKDKMVSWMMIVLDDMGLNSSDYNLTANGNNINVEFLGETLESSGEEDENSKFR